MFTNKDGYKRPGLFHFGIQLGEIIGIFVNRPDDDRGVDSLWVNLKADKIKLNIN